MGGGGASCMMHGWREGWCEGVKQRALWERLGLMHTRTPDGVAGSAPLRVLTFDEGTPLACSGGPGGEFVAEGGMLHYVAGVRVVLCMCVCMCTRQHTPRNTKRVCRMADGPKQMGLCKPSTWTLSTVPPITCSAFALYLCLGPCLILRLMAST